MYASVLLTLGALALGTAASPLKARDNQNWAGSNIYMLQGLSSDVQDAYLKELSGAGAKVVRIWVNAQSAGCQKGINVANDVSDYEPSLGDYQSATLDALDATIAKIAANGMKALISPHDGNVISGSNGNDAYGQKYGTGFYTNTEAKSKYDARIASILNYTSKSSGKRWGDWSDAIMGFDVQNEPFASTLDTCSGNDASDWLCGRAGNMKKLLNNNIKISTGGVGGDISHNCNFMKKAMECDAIDLVAVHGYKGTEAKNPGEWAGNVDNWMSESNGKLLYVEEFGTVEGDDQQTDFQGQADDITNGQIPWIYWQILPPKTCNTVGDDTYGVWQDNTVDWASSVKKAAAGSAKQSWSGIVY